MQKRFERFKYLFRYIHLLLKVGSEADSLVSKIVDVTVLTDEGVSQNPGRSEASAVEGEDSHEALVFAGSIINNVVDGLDRVGLSSNNNVQGSRVGLAVNSVGLGQCVPLKVNDQKSVGVDNLQWLQQPGQVHQ